MTVEFPAELVRSDLDERLMKSTLLKCYDANALGFQVSAEHYRYLAEQIVSLREHIKRSEMEVAMTDPTIEEIVAEIMAGVPSALPMGPLLRDDPRVRALIASWRAQREALEDIKATLDEYGILADNPFAVITHAKALATVCLNAIASNEPCKPDDTLRRCTICGFMVDIKYKADVGALDR